MAATWADDIFKCNFINENISFSINSPLNFVPKGPTDNKWSLVEVMAWRRTGDITLPEPMMTQFSDAYASSDLNELMQDWSNSRVLAMELLQSCAKPLFNVVTLDLWSSMPRIKLYGINLSADTTVTHQSIIITAFGDLELSLVI